MKFTSQLERGLYRASITQYHQIQEAGLQSSTHNHNGFRRQVKLDASKLPSSKGLASDPRVEYLKNFLNTSQISMLRHFVCVKPMTELTACLQARQ